MYFNLPILRQLARNFAPRLGVNLNFNLASLGVRTKYDFKMQYFDRNIIRRNWTKINYGPLSRAAAYVRRTARNSIRRDLRKGKFGLPSREGTPPFARAGASTSKLPPFKMIFHDLEMFQSQAVVGMVWLGSDPAVPGLHESGGFARRVVWSAYDKSSRQPAPGARLVTRTVRYPKRPFMRPALQKSLPVIQTFWENSLSKAS